MNNFQVTTANSASYDTRYFQQQIWAIPHVDKPAYAVAPTVSITFYNSQSTSQIQQWAQKRVGRETQPNTGHIYWPSKANQGTTMAWNVLKACYLALIQAGYVKVVSTCSAVPGDRN